MLAEAKKWEQKINDLMRKDSGENVYDLLFQLKDIMSIKAGVFRVKADLANAMSQIALLREKFKKAFISGSCFRYCQEFVTISEFDSMLDIAEVIVLGALKREETRGSHYRLDFQKRDDTSWLKHTLVNWSEKGPKVSFKDIKIGKYKPVERKY